MGMATHADDEAVLRALNEQFIEAFRQGSWETLEPVLSDSFAYLDGATGDVWPHERYIENLRANPRLPPDRSGRRPRRRRHGGRVGAHVAGAADGTAATSTRMRVEGTGGSASTRACGRSPRTSRRLPPARARSRPARSPPCRATPRAGADVVAPRASLRTSALAATRALARASGS